MQKRDFLNNKNKSSLVEKCPENSYKSATKAISNITRAQNILSGLARSSTSPGILITAKWPTISSNTKTLDKID